MAEITNTDNPEKLHDKDGLQKDNTQSIEQNPSRIIYLSTANTDITTQSFGKSLPGFATLLPVKYPEDITECEKFTASVQGTFLKYFIKFASYIILYTQVINNFQTHAIMRSFLTKTEDP